MRIAESVKKKASKYVGWVYGVPEDIPRLRDFGFTGELRHYKSPLAGDVIQYVSASEEVMEKACKEWPNLVVGYFDLSFHIASAARLSDPSNAPRTVFIPSEDKVNSLT